MFNVFAILSVVAGEEAGPHSTKDVPQEPRGPGRQSYVL